MRGSKMKAITGGIILTPEKEIKDGKILIKNGIIHSIGTNLKLPDDVQVIDAKNKYIIPGLVDGHTHLGMVTDGIEWEASDVNDRTNPNTIQMRTIDAINLFDDGFNEALSGGVTTVYTGPGSSNILGGIGAIVKTYASTKEKMIINDFASIKIALGPKRNPEGLKTQTPYPTTRMGSVAFLRSILSKTKEYVDGKIDPSKIDSEEKMMLDHLSKLIKREVPAHIHTSNMPDEINAAIRIIEEFKIKATIDHGFGSEFFVEKIAKKNIPVIYGPVMMTKRSAGLKYISDRTPGILSSNGVKTSIMTDAPLIPGKHLLLSAAVAFKNGMIADDALKAVTINPAESIGVGELVGSIEKGKKGDITILSGHPLKVKSRVETVLIDGEIAYQR
jgi:imidazolonepropionase-like amidohydrolase